MLFCLFRADNGHVYTAENSRYNNVLLTNDDGIRDCPVYNATLPTIKIIVLSAIPISNFTLLRYYHYAFV